jgi:hypothetical protein
MAVASEDSTARPIKIFMAKKIITNSSRGAPH